MVEVIEHAVIDTLPIIPVLLIVHILIEIFEVHKLGKLKANGVLSGKFAPLIGTGVGLLPQCGFSIVASEMYAKKYIQAGTLIAVFVATSDEALPIMLGAAATDGTAWVKLLTLIGIKVVMALAAGYIVNLFAHKNRGEAATRTNAAEDEKIEEVASHGCCGHKLPESDDAHESGDAHEDGGEEPKQSAAGKAGKFFSTYLKHPLIHTALITLYIFIVNAVIGGIIHGVTEEKLAEFMQSGMYLQPLLAVVVGLIPNCASSVVITQLYMSGVLSLGASVAGLAVNAGLGLAVLFKANKNLRVNLLITAGLVVYSLAVGYAITLAENIIVA